jgi:hypothetical protein
MGLSVPDPTHQELAAVSNTAAVYSACPDSYTCSVGTNELHGEIRKMTSFGRKETT